jgi:hypothetical protein
MAGFSGIEVSHVIAWSRSRWPNNRTGQGMKKAAVRVSRRTQPRSLTPRPGRKLRTVEELYQAARARRSGRWGPAERIEAHRNAELAVTRSRRLARLIDATRHRVQTSQTPRP